MAVRMMHSFDNFTSVDDLSKTVTEAGYRGDVTIDTTGGRFGGAALKLGCDTSNTQVNFAFERVSNENEDNDAAFGFWLKASSTAIKPSAVASFFTLYNSTESSTSLGGNYRIRCNPSGSLTAYDWGDSQITMYGFTDVCDGQWHWIEGRAKPATSGGHLSLYIDGQLEWIQTGNVVDIFSNKEACSRFMFYTSNEFGGTGEYFLFDDLIIYDDQTLETGDLTPAADYPLGPVRMEHLSPSGAGTNTNLTASAGANYTCVDDNVHNIDTDYVESGTTNTYDTYAFDNLAGTPVTMFGVCVGTSAKSAEPGDMSYRSVCLSSATTNTGATYTLRPAYYYEQYCFPRDPNTAAAWTASGVNAAEFGFEVI